MVDDVADFSVKESILAIFISLIVKFAPGLKITVCAVNESAETCKPFAVLVNVANPLSMGADDIVTP
jgi:hypothetical protein